MTDQNDTDIEGLLAAVKDLEASTNSLASKEYVAAAAKEEEAKRKRFANAVIGVGLAFVILFGVLLIGLFQIKGLAETNKGINEDSRGNTTTIVDCLRPSTEVEEHKCYEARIARFDKQLRDSNDRLLLDILTIANVPNSQLPPAIKKRLEEMGAENPGDQITP